MWHGRRPASLLDGDGSRFRGDLGPVRVRELAERASSNAEHRIADVEVPDLPSNGFDPSGEGEAAVRGSEASLTATE
ncbi:MAG: hypothetical protein L3K17_02190 [Thermoplasmata archaeon]|nr:hypothetical protein [Thermoplasmata archaeon]